MLPLYLAIKLYQFEMISCSYFLYILAGFTSLKINGVWQVSISVDLSPGNLHQYPVLYKTDDSHYLFIVFSWVYCFLIVLSGTIPHQTTQ